jgi:predicted HTH domain antitoxin
LSIIDFPEEFMRDPAYWVNAQQLESWLQLFVEAFQPLECSDLLEEIGTQIPELRAWGVLDSVLKMMPRPQEIMNQPERFLSYFISPAPPVANLRREMYRVAFDLPISTEQFPLTTTLLKAAFSVLPCYVGQVPAKCDWSDIHFSLSWSQEMGSLLPPEEQNGHRISPELMQSIIEQLEQNQRDLEKRNEELVRKNEELVFAHRELKEHINIQMFNEKMKGLSEFALVVAKDLQVPAEILAQEIMRMQDYMVRAEQVITLMNGLEKNSPLLKEILRRVDWDWAKNYFHKSLKESEEALISIRKLSAELRKGSQETLETLISNNQKQERSSSTETVVGEKDLIDLPEIKVHIGLTEDMELVSEKKITEKLHLSKENAILTTTNKEPRQKELFIN